MHPCRASLVQTLAVQETFVGHIVWDGAVSVFDLSDHPEATRAYAWSFSIDGSSERRFFAVLHIPPITSVADAVRVAVVAEQRANQEGTP